ncbi:MAG: hypothetical protein QT02_C0004G0027 [archaeon GW2011_AR9]|nr:MAG: hypothetical protein QT02_C0004G0027 [archaeon GW2011_AR9]MBS3120404.1 hypothetical protein [Candidatus Woesearchaeota archaeon]HIG93838.1 hypothetical protein [Candidatus Woesearchaeota archaeon]HIH12789.1 hypothetical protein [Candidatus Woesearchaeota archaeon]
MNVKSDSFIKYLVGYLVGLTVLLFLMGCSSQPQDPLSINLRDHKQIVQHIHPTLQIEINDQIQLIPADIGITEQGLRVIHTHDEPGILHVESPFPYQFYLKDFFTIWGKRFDSQCIFDSCIDNDHELKVYLDGQEDTRFGDIPLQDDQQIRIVYQKKG